MRQDPPKQKLPRPATRNADTAETDAQNRSDAGVPEHADPAHGAAKRERRERHSNSEFGYSVGYGRPPKDRQFKPGQSGNPRGRLPLTRNLKTMVKQVVEEQVQIAERGKLRRMSKLEALFRTLISRAFKGDPKAVASILVILKQSGYGTEAIEVSPELPAGIDHESILKEFLGRLGREEPTGDDGPAEEFAEHDSPPKKGKQ